MNSGSQQTDCVEIIREESRITEDSGKGGWLTFWRRPSRRERQIAALQDGYAEMLGLMRSIRLNLERQTETQQLLHTHLPDAVEGLQAIGRHTEQQTELIQLMNKQFESTLDHDKKMVGSIDRFNDTLTVMDETNRHSATVLCDLAERTREAEDLVRTMLIRSQRRLMIMVVILLLTTLAVAATAFYLFV